MLLAETSIFYLVFGVCVAVAAYVRNDACGRVASASQAATACLFWPLFLPMLLSGATPQVGGSEDADDTKASCDDSLAAAISQVEAELDKALEGLDGWAEDVLNSERQRLEELRSSWKLQAERIREIDRL